MLQPMTRRARRGFGWIADGFQRWRTRGRLKRELSRFSEQELDRILADAGLSRSDLDTMLDGGADNHTLMSAMMAHFGAPTGDEVFRYWGALRDAERVCTHCSSVKRCRRWLDWGAKNDAPRVFCPNAELFDEMAEAARTTERSTGAPASGSSG